MSGCGLPSHSSTCPSPWFLGKLVLSAEWRRRSPSQAGPGWNWAEGPPGPAVGGAVQEADPASRGCGPHRCKPSSLTSSPFAHRTPQRTPPSGPKQTPLEGNQLPGANVSV